MFLHFLAHHLKFLVAAHKFKTAFEISCARRELEQHKHQGKQRGQKSCNRNLHKQKLTPHWVLACVRWLVRRPPSVWCALSAGTLAFQSTPGCVQTAPALTPPSLGSLTAQQEKRHFQVRVDYFMSSGFRTSTGFQHFTCLRDQVTNKLIASTVVQSLICTMCMW